MSYVCPCCGRSHDGLPDIAFDRPAYAHHIPEEERAGRVRLDADLCVVDDEHHFIRGVVEVSIHGYPETFGIGAWVSQKPEHFRAYAERPESAALGPSFGWLSNAFEFGGEPALNLKARVHFRGGGLRPRIELEPTDHPLAVAQQEGISLNEAWAFVHGHLDPSAT